MSQTGLDWNAATEARIPTAELARLASLRDRADVRVRTADSWAWITWTTNGIDVIRALMPSPDATFYRIEGETRYRLGQLLPTVESPPLGNDRSLASLLIPEKPLALPVTDGPQSRAQWRIVRGGSVRPTTALVCHLHSLTPIAESATTAELAAIRGLFDANRAILFGANLPAVAGSTRFYGNDLLLPLGYCPEFDLPAKLLLESLGVTPGDKLMATEEFLEVIPADRAEPLTRAGLRLAISGASPP